MNGVLTLAGPCPACGHTTGADVTPMAVGVTAGVGESGRFSAPTLIACDCPDKHAGRPDDLPGGCGAWWVCQPKFDAATKAYTVVPVPTEDPNFRAAIAVYQATHESSQAIRALAEKWIPGIAAVTGTLGLAAVVVSADSVKGASQGWRIAAFVAVAVAVVLAATATVLAYRAAFGWPKEIPTETEADVLNAARMLGERGKLAASHVRSALWFAGLSLGVLLVALGILWIQPKPQLPLKVTYLNGGDRAAEAVVCGKFRGAADGQLRLLVTDPPHTTTESIPLRDVTKVEQVSTCEG